MLCVDVTQVRMIIFFHTSTVDVLLSTDLKVVIYSGQLDLIVDTIGNTYLYIYVIVS